MIIEQNIIKSLMDNMSKIEVQSRDTYQLDGKRVPRVTEVLSAMLHEDGLMSWANNLGWKRISYKAFMKEAADKGTFSHMAIEKYIKDGYINIDELGIINDPIKDVVNSCLDGFIKWWNYLHTIYKNIEVVFLEETMIHPYFGGTCDCLLKVDNEYYLIDFKTSNHMSYNYGLQLAAYRFLLKEMKNIILNKCSILMLSKTDHNYKTYDLDLSKEEDIKYIEDCEQTFLTLVSAYKMRLYTLDEYYNIFNIEKR